MDEWNASALSHSILDEFPSKLKPMQISIDSSEITSIYPHFLSNPELLKDSIL
jgi:hypothetical protein